MGPISENMFTQAFQELVEQKSADLVENKRTLTQQSYQEHFEKSKKAINQAFQDLRGGTAVVFGVGAAQDIDLQMLGQRFDQVRLIDIDLSQTRKALQEQVPEELRGKFVLENIDITGVFSSFCPAAEAIAREDIPYEEFLYRVVELLPREFLAVEEKDRGSADFVCSSLVSTQLVTVFWTYVNDLSEKKYGEPFEIPIAQQEGFDRSLQKMIENHVQKLHDLVSPSGRIYYADHFSGREFSKIKWPVGLNVPEEVNQEPFSDIPFAKTVSKTVNAMFQILSEKNWIWTLPLDTGDDNEFVQVMMPDGNVQQFPVKIEAVREYLVTAYTLSRKS